MDEYYKANAKSVQTVFQGKGEEWQCQLARADAGMSIESAPACQLDLMMAQAKSGKE